MESIKLPRFWETACLVGFFICVAAGFMFVHDAPVVSGLLFAVAMAMALTVAGGVVSRSLVIRASSFAEASRSTFRIATLIALLFVALWTLVAVIKWMWFHS